MQAFRNAENGEFVTEEYARANPTTTTAIQLPEESVRARLAELEMFEECAAVLFDQPTTAAEFRAAVGQGRVYVK